MDILGLTPTGLIVIITLIVGLVLINELWKIKQMLKEKELEDICNYLNTKEVYIRTKDCKLVNFYAHVVHYVQEDDDKIMIDID